MDYKNTANYPAVDGVPFQSVMGKLLDFYIPLMKSCSPYTSLVMCSLHLPKCEDGVPRPVLPCRSVCQKFVKDCQGYLRLASVGGMFTALCDLLPKYNSAQPQRCILPKDFERPTEGMHGCTLSLSFLFCFLPPFHFPFTFFHFPFHSFFLFLFPPFPLPFQSIRFHFTLFSLFPFPFPFLSIHFIFSFFPSLSLSLSLVFPFFFFPCLFLLFYSLPLFQTFQILLHSSQVRQGMFATNLSQAPVKTIFTTTPHSYQVRIR